jgi:hypothetical protein
MRKTVIHESFSTEGNPIFPSAGFCFDGLIFHRPAHYTALNSGITVISNVGSPVLTFAEIQGNSTKQTNLTFEKKDILEQLPYPNTRFFSFCLKSDIAAAQGKLSSFGFGRFMKIVEISVYRAKFQGKDFYIDYEYFDNRDQQFELEINLKVDVAFCLTLSNGQSILIYWDDGSESYLTYMGTKAAFAENNIVRSNWLRSDNWLNWEAVQIAW